MKIKKDSLLHKFLFYLDEPSTRPNEEDIFTLFLRCAALAILMPFMTVLMLLGSWIGFTFPLYFWQGHIYQKPKKLGAKMFSSMRKYWFFKLLMLAFAFIVLCLILYLWWQVISRVPGWMDWASGFGGNSYKPALASLVALIFLWTFRRHLPKVEYID